MALPEIIQQKIESLCESVPLSTLKLEAEKLSDTYRNSKRGGIELLDNKVSTLAYIASRLPATYSAISSVLLGVKETFDNLEVKTVIDVGAGPGTATIAINNILGKKSVTLIERNPDMIEVGKQLLSELECECEWVQNDIKDFSKNADLIISAYMFNEMDENAVKDLVQKLYTKADKALVIVDNGTKDAFSMMKIVRETLISIGANILAPCANESECQNEWCHFSARVGRTKLHKILKGGDAPFEDEKFTYLVATKVPSENHDRILRHPKILKGRVELELCTKNGIEHKTITKTQKEIFKIARKSTWGETI